MTNPRCSQAAREEDSNLGEGLCLNTCHMNQQSRNQHGSVCLPYRWQHLSAQYSSVRPRLALLMIQDKSDPGWLWAKDLQLGWNGTETKVKHCCPLPEHYLLTWTYTQLCFRLGLCPAAAAAEPWGAQNQPCSPSCPGAGSGQHQSNSDLTMQVTLMARRTQ